MGMTKYKRSINKVIHDKLTGEISDDELKQFQEWINSSPENKTNYDQLLNETELSNRYRQYAAIDAERAHKLFYKNHHRSYQLLWHETLKYAAILLLVIAGASIWLLKNNKVIYRPEISHETMVAMLRGQNMGKQHATLILPNGKKVSLKTLSSVDKTMQKVEVASDNSQTIASVENSNRLMTQGDSEYWVTLDDGTRVHLNYSTTLKYPVHFSDDKRTVYLEGEAYFYVAKDSKRPFYVETPNGTVREYGTSFNVNTNDESGKTKVVLVEGSISVITGQGNEYKIKPGEMAVMQSASQQVQINKVDVDAYIAWNSGRFIFDNCPLEKLMTTIARWYGKDIVFMSNDVKQMRYTGDIDRYSSISLVLKAIKNVTGLEIENTQNKIIVKKSSNND